MCPNCHGRSIGRIGSEQYYCWDCCVEFNTGRGAVRIYHLDPDGELIAAADHQLSDSMIQVAPVMQRRL